MKLYSTVEKEASASQVIEKSKFTAYVKPVSSKEEADLFIAEIRKKHKDATHNVPAVVVGDKMQIQWASDDGEPQGTSGAPMVKLLVAEEITDVVIVVTRYFGGIKLGTGGLVRAYTSSAKLGLEAAGVCDVYEQTVTTYVLDYTFIAKVQNLEGGLFTIRDIRYGEKVEADLACEPEKTAELEALMDNVTGGRGKVKERREMPVKKLRE